MIERGISCCTGERRSGTVMRSQRTDRFYWRRRRDSCNSRVTSVSMPPPPPRPLTGIDWRLHAPLRLPPPPPLPPSDCSTMEKKNYINPYTVDLIFDWFDKNILTKNRIYSWIECVLNNLFYLVWKRVAITMVEVVNCLPALKFYSHTHTCT